MRYWSKLTFSKKNDERERSGTIFLKSIFFCFYDFRNWFFRTIKMSLHAFWNKKCVAHQLVSFLCIIFIYTTLRYFFRELNTTFFHGFSAVNYDSVLSFFPARQVSEIILNESSKSTENALIEWLQQDKAKYFLKS
jgi:hypothetical protein